MSTVKVQSSIFRKYFKIRYPIILIIGLVAVLIIPLFFPYYENFNPVYSIENTGEYGHSQLRNYLDDDYTVSREILDFTNIEGNHQSLLIINSPQEKFSEREKNHLFDLLYGDQMSVLLIGNTDPLVELSRSFDISITPEGTPSRIFDFTNNYNDDPAYVKGRITRNYGNSEVNHEFISLNPTSIENYDFSYQLSTYNTAELSSCISAIGQGCSEQFTIGGIQDNDINIGVISDNWFLSNLLLDKTTMNLNIIDFIITHFENIENIIFDEVHLEWAPVNANGVNWYIENKLSTTLVTILFVLIILVIPFFLLFSGGALSKLDEETEVLSDDIKKRLNYLHIERVPAAPLSLEERILVDEKLEHSIRKHYYFQYVAYDIHQFITKYSLEGYFDDSILSKLVKLQYIVVLPQSAWSIIKAVNKRLIELIDNREIIVFTNVSDKND